MIVYREKLKCPFCKSIQLHTFGENCRCVRCEARFTKKDGIKVRIEEKNKFPPTLKKILAGKKGEVVDLKACPFCGSASINGAGSAANGFDYICAHCMKHIKKGDLIKYGEKAIVKINKHEVVQ